MADTALAPKRNASWTANSFWWTDTMTTDTDKARAFYTDVLGWSWEDGGAPNNPYWMASLDGLVTAGLGEQSAEMVEQGVPPMWNSYILVDSVDATIAKIEGNGGTIIMPAMDVMDIGRMAFAMDPTGGAFGLWEAKTFKGCDAVNQPGTLLWNGLWSDDVDAAKTFYTEVFGWSYIEQEMMGMPYYMATLDGETPIGGLAGNPMKGKIPTHWAVTIGVADVEATAKQVEAAGGTVQMGPGEMGPGIGIRVLDPNGAFVEFLQMNEWPA